MSKVTQKHFRHPFRPSKVPLRPAGGYSSRWSVHSCVTCMADLSRYPCPDIFQITTIRCSYKIPFSCRIHFHPGLNPFIIKQHFQTFSTVKSPYQSINLMIIIHIFCYNCCILIFLLFHCDILSFPLIVFHKDALFQGPLHFFQLQTNCQYIHNVPSAPYQTSPCLLSTGA